MSRRECIQSNLPLTSLPRYQEQTRQRSRASCSWRLGQRIGPNPNVRYCTNRQRNLHRSDTSGCMESRVSKSRGLLALARSCTDICRCRALDDGPLAALVTIEALVFVETDVAWSLTGWAVIGLYGISRVVVIVEMFRCLFYATPDTFISTWTANVPHFG